MDKDGIEKIKSGIAKEIFRQELTELYRQQTIRRDELIEKSGEIMSELVAQMQTGTLDNPRIEQLMVELSHKLKNTNGKKQYGYLKAPVKAIVDEIVDELAKEPRVAAAYELWYLLREDVLKTYRNELPERLPLSRQKEFKRIRNLVVEEAAKLGEDSELLYSGVDAKHNAADIEPEHTQSLPDRRDASPPLLKCATRLLHHMGNIFREQAPLSVGGICFVDSKLRRKMQEKKVAMGHKRDDHEEQQLRL